MTRNAIRGGREGGFSLLELLVTILVIGIVSSFAIYGFNNVLPTLRADSASQLLVAQLRQARQASVDQRRDMLVTFRGTSEIVTVRLNLDSTTTPLSDYFLPYGMVYMLFSGVPDTRDGFGNSAAVNFNCGGSGLPCTIRFQSDGSVLDSTGNYINGTVFIGRTGQNLTARAVTILGATGRIRGWRYNGNADPSKAWF
jgi:prepilin-type N-terminal cleavage/methylation domain-containing protein